jgi:hypothetical protein
MNKVPYYGCGVKSKKGKETYIMNVKRAQDILRHIVNDKDYGAAMMEKISVSESIYVVTQLLPDCIKEAQAKNNLNDTGFFSEMLTRYRPLVLEKIKKAEHLWVVYSDNTGYPYMIDGDLFVLFDYANHAELEKKLNFAGYKIALESVDAADFKNEIAHMYRNGYDKIRFTDGKGEPFIVDKEELYAYEEFFNDEYMINPGLQKTMIDFFQEFRKEAPMDSNRGQILKTREDEMIKALVNAEYMVPCVKEETEEQIEISHPFVDLTDKVTDREEGERVIAIPVFTDGFELDKCYEGHHEDMLYQYDELVNLVDELGASGVVINCLGISYYMKRDLLKQIANQNS